MLVEDDFAGVAVGNIAGVAVGNIGVGNIGIPAISGDVT